MSAKFESKQALSREVHVCFFIYVNVFYLNVVHYACIETDMCICKVTSVSQDSKLPVMAGLF